MTGARGYIGGRLVEHLAKVGFRVRAGSRRPAETRDANGNVIGVETDFESAESLSAACRGCDAVVHLASLNEIECTADPEAATLVNTIYTQRLARVAAASGVGRFVYFSTVHVYGAPLSGRITEESPANPAHPYSISHKAAEDYLRWSAPKSKMEVDIFRLTNSFGYPVSRDVQRWSLVANDAAKQLAETGKVILKTPGTQLRDFIGLVDVCRATALVAQREPVVGYYGLYNLGGDYVASVFEIVSRVAAAYQAITGRIPSIERPAVSAAPRDELEVDMHRLKGLGFSLSLSGDDELYELVRRCLEWFAPDYREIQRASMQRSEIR